MNTEVNDFLENLSEEQLEALKQLLEKEDYDDKRAKKTKKIQKTTSETKKEKEEEEEITVNKDFTVSRNTNQTERKSPVKFKKNQWIDEGEHGDIETPKFQKTPRNRSKPNKQEVECHVCGRTFSVNSNLVYGEYHRCNKCTGR